MRCCASPSVLDAEECPLVVNVNTSNAVSDVVGGTIACTVENSIGSCMYEWKTADGHTALLQLSDDRSEARNVLPGVYLITVTDGADRRVSVQTRVKMIDILTVVGYKVTHATSDTARDGRIEVAIKESREQSCAVEYLWTTGVVTASPLLEDVRPGMYTVTPVTMGGKVNVPFIHACEPACVNPSRRNEN